ncbi:MAG: hypothetical protein V3U39_09420 [Acidimicrobiia bacterium]|jgi:hypothetical protein
MRVAVHATSTIGKRALRVLQGEPHVTEAGFWGPEETEGKTPTINDLRSVDVLVAEKIPPKSLVEAALETRTHLVVAANEGGDLGSSFAAEGISLVLGANPAAGLACCLAAQEAAFMDEPLEVRLAWTVPGRLRRRGEAIPFPDPVGSMWARPTDAVGWVQRDIPVQAFAAPLESSWQAAMAQVSGAVDDGVQRTIVGTADDGEFLAAIALAAAVVPTGQHAYGPGMCWVAEAPSPYLDRALAGGIDVASYHDRTSA